MKSHVLAVNTSAHIHVPEKNEEKDNNTPRLKHGRPLGSRDVAPRKNRERNQELMLYIRSNLRMKQPQKRLRL